MIPCLGVQVAIGKNVVIIIKTAAELTGIMSALGALKKIGQRLHKNSILIRGLTKLTKKLWNVTKALGGIMGGLGRVGGKALGMVTRGMLALTAAAAGAIREFIVYNFQMARAWTMMDIGFSKFVALRRQIVGMAGDLGVAKSELAGGLYQALSAGVPKDNVLTFLSVAAKAAVADMGDTATAVDGLTTVMNAFKIPFTEAQKIADLMFTTVKNGKTTFGELAANLSTVAPIAASNGIAFEQIAAAIATLTKQGTPTAQAMTQIRAAIIGLNENLGDGWSKTMTLQEAFGKMTEKAGGSQVKLKELMGRVEGVSAVLGITGQNAKMATKDLAAMSNAAGSADEAFKKMDRMRHWPKLWETLRGIMTRIGEVLDNVVKPVVIDITKRLKAWRDNDVVFDTMEKKLAAMRDHALNIWAALKGGDGAAKTMFVGIKDVLVGVFLIAAQAAVKLLVKAGPIIGDLIGKAIKFGPERAAVWFAERKSAKEAGISTEEMHQLNLEAQGKTAAKKFGGAGQERLARGLETLQGVSSEGAAIRKKAVTESIGKISSADGGKGIPDDLTDVQKQAKAKQLLDARFDVEAAESIKASRQLTAAAGSGVTGNAMNVIRANASRQESDVKRVIAALEAVSKGDEARTNAILAWAKKVTEKNKQLEQQIKTLPIS